MSATQSLPDVTARRRVAPLAPDERRAALIDATLPLLRTHGLSVSTRQIAKAAGVAEGTIFRVFPDKSSLIVAAVLAGTDPSGDIAAIVAIDPLVDLRDRLTQATAVLTRRLRHNGRLHRLAHELMIDPATARAIATELHESRQRILAALTGVIAPDRERLRVGPPAAARVMLSLVVAADGRVFGEPDLLDGDEIVAVLLDGLLSRQSPTPREPTC